MRAFPRLSLSCDIDYSYVPGAIPIESGTDASSTKARDISEGGICLITATPLVKGGVISLKFKLQGHNRPIEALGRVVWTQAFAIGTQMGYDNGIEFVKMTDDDKVIVEKYIKSMFPG
jgi:hypothetical protein